MKKILTSALVLGLVAVPSIALAQNGADDNNPSNNVRHEDRRQDRHQERNRHNSHGSSSVKVENEATLPANGITLEQASAIAQEVFPGSTIVKIELEAEHGTTVYSVRFSDGNRVDVDATTGQVVRSGSGSNSHEDEDENEDHQGDENHSDNSGRDHPEDD